MSMTCGKSPRQALGRTPDVNLPVSITPAKQKFPEPRQGASTYTGGIIGGIICVIILIAIIATTIVMVRKCQRKNIDRPPTHKPPPPTKTYSYSDRPSISKPESDPELMHHDTEKEEPMTDHLVYYDDKDHHEPSLEDNKTPYHDDRDEDEDGMMGEEDIYYITSSATRGSSFMSPAVIV